MAGIIPDEFQRKTLHYLLASRLSSAEIVLGKLGARLVHVVAFVALGLPIVSLLMLYGGLNPANILYVYLEEPRRLVLFQHVRVLDRNGVRSRTQAAHDAIVATYGLGAIWFARSDHGQRDRGVTLKTGRWAGVPKVNERVAALESHQGLVARDAAEDTTGQAARYTPGWSAVWNFHSSGTSA